LKRFRDAQRGPSTSIPTLGRLQRSMPGKWLWLCCAANGCTHHAPMAIAPFVIRWGADASSDRLRHSARCSRCGHNGAMLMHPCWVSSEVGFQPFPVG
jgi:hypothetical protein